ncbi:hypothetical protein QGN29_01505 [Temperatibacter marinus]|uniref:WalW protein n=1 Tax=Temperatibacter marinus TaxID=1456591 RepID=A0AA52H9L4_9PROT|nr:hypothetical protein [Temperatibacter marinus]WND03039.1 hypothetical protein QGN29_01505 [Temperatibacter marinus]
MDEVVKRDSLVMKNAVQDLTHPLMTVVIDTEEEFDWSAPFSRSARSVENIKHQHRMHQAVFKTFDIKPCYVLDQAVLEDDWSVEYFKTLHGLGEIDLGVHLHPWLTPPYEEEVSAYNSYQGNLSEDLEFKKIETITALFERRIGFSPKIFKAGRYGLGPNSIALLHRAGYEIDLSVVPNGTYQYQDGGTNYLRAPHQPFELQQMAFQPLTRHFTGWLSLIGPALGGLFDYPLAKKLKLIGLLSRLGISRVVLSPEGMPTSALYSLLAERVAKGDRFFSMAYHSSSLMKGGSPYAASEENIDHLCDCLSSVATYFKEDLGGEFISVTDFAVFAAKELPEE